MSKFTIKRKMNPFSPKANPKNKIPKWLMARDREGNSYVWFGGKNACLSAVKELDPGRVSDYESLPERTFVHVGRKVFLIEVVRWIDGIQRRDNESVERYEERISGLVRRVGDWWHSYYLENMSD